MNGRKRKRNKKMQTPKGDSLEGKALCGAQVNGRARVRREGRGSGAREAERPVDGKHANEDEWERERDRGGQEVERRASVCETRMEVRGGDPKHRAKSKMLGGGGGDGHIAVSRETKERSERAP